MALPVLGANTAKTGGIADTTDSTKNKMFVKYLAH